MYGNGLLRPTTPQCSSIPLRFISLTGVRPMGKVSHSTAFMQA